MNAHNLRNVLHLAVTYTSISVTESTKVVLGKIYLCSVMYYIRAKSNRVWYNWRRAKAAVGLGGLSPLDPKTP